MYAGGGIGVVRQPSGHLTKGPCRKHCFDSGGVAFISPARASNQWLIESTFSCWASRSYWRWVRLHEERFVFSSHWCVTRVAPPPAGICADGLVLGGLHAAPLPDAAHGLELRPDEVWSRLSRPGESSLLLLPSHPQRSRPRLLHLTLFFKCSSINSKINKIEKNLIMTGKEWDALFFFLRF